MDKNKKFINDGIQLAILSRELPDRLIVYHTIVQVIIIIVIINIVIVVIIIIKG